MSVKEVLTNIADCMRALTGTTEKITLSEMTDKVVEVYSCGKELGTDEGKQAEYDRFWNEFQYDGKLTDYARRFLGWRASILKPKHNIQPTRVDYMFMNIFPEYNVTGYSIKKCFEDANITFDTSLCTNFAYMIYYGYASDVPELDTRGATSLNAIFNYARLLKSAKMILKDDGSQTWNNSFVQAIKLTDFEIISGVIGKDCDIHWSPLTKESILSIYNHLSTTATFTVTFNLNAVNKAFETSEGANDGSTSEEWKALIAGKPSGVTINLLNA